MNSKVLNPVESSAEIATILQIIMAINALSKVFFLSFGLLKMLLGAIFPFLSNCTFCCTLNLCSLLKLSTVGK